MKLFQLTLLAVLFGCSGFAQNAPKKAAPSQTAVIFSHRPQSKDYPDFEQYIDALVEWKVAQIVSPDSKQVLLNAPELPGRYQIVIRPNIRADTFLLDTVTGRIWNPVEITNVQGTPTIWKAEERVDSDLDYSVWSARQTLIQNQASPQPTPKEMTSPQ